MFSAIIINNTIKRLLNQHGSDCQDAKKIRDQIYDNSDNTFPVNTKMRNIYAISSMFVIFGIILFIIKIGHNKTPASIFLTIGVITFVITAIFDAMHCPDSRQIYNNIKEIQCQCYQQLLIKDNSSPVNCKFASC